MITVGVGLRPGSTEAAVRALLDRVAAAHGLELGDAVVATLDRRASEPGLRAAVAPREPHGFAAAALAAVAVPRPGTRVAAAVGTPSVAEAAALLAAGNGAHLIVGKTAAQGVTVAVAARAADVGLPSEGSSRTCGSGYPPASPSRGGLVQGSAATAGRRSPGEERR
ncbi:cobalamin biosynthesis protein [Pseudonocardia tropica]|uniref:Cobalamin biosynthesis protein n=1 Tax=Pseudonocardia tropica TaxID=681289 RepID=A0ABV1JV02_9PSEU